MDLLSYYIVLALDLLIGVIIGLPLQGNDSGMILNRFQKDQASEIKIDSLHFTILLGVKLLKIKD